MRRSRRRESFFDQKLSQYRSWATCELESLIINDEAFENLSARRHSIVRWWKNKYNISRSDERFQNATMLMIYEDYLDHVAEQLNSRWNNDFEEKMERSQLKKNIGIIP